MVRRAPRRRAQIWVAPVAGVVVVLGVLGGMSVLGSGQSQFEPRQPCAGNEPAPGVPPAPQTVVLVDRSRSARGLAAASGSANDYVATLRATVDDAVEAGHTVSVAAFDGAASSIRWAASATAFRGNADRRVLHVQRHKECLEKALRAAAGSPPERQGSDVFAALSAAADRVGQDAPAGSQVVIATDGLSNAGCSDVDHAAVGDVRQISAIVRDCRAEDPVELARVAVRIVGIGQTGPGVPAPSSEQSSWLQQLWHAMCSATDATCDVDDTAASGAAGMAVSADAPDDPPVEFPDVTTYRPAGRTLVMELPDSVLFDFGRAELRAHAPIDKVITQLRHDNARDIKVEGHTDSVGKPEDNLNLSKRRAAAVAAALRARGIKVSEVNGFGETRLKNQQETRRDGTPDLRAMAENRRVEVVATVSVPTG
jgi:outer membrane protein OmpA-like peptidoglycan-associated protein